MTLLGVTLFAYLLFLWIRDRKIWLALLCGGCIGATSLFRLTPLFLFPAGACLVMPAFWKLGKKIIFSHLSAYTLAFLIILVPWIIAGINPKGGHFLLDKLFHAYNKHYGSIDNSIQVPRQSGLPEMGITALKWEENAVLVRHSGIIQEWTANDYGMSALSQNTAGMQVNGINETGGPIYRFLDHFLHNFSASVLSMPDSLIFDNLNHLSQQVYWSDNRVWHGDLPVSQTVLVFLNLFLIAIGLGYSWIHHRWAGMIPMTIFIAYSLSLAAAMDSGGRYIVPMDWVLYFYYGLAIVVIIQFVYKVLTGRDQGQPTSLDSGATRRISDRWSLGFSLAGIICLASLIPIANFALPAVSDSTRNRADVELIRESISSQENPGVRIVYGLILYPYDIDGTLTFDFLKPSRARSYTIIRGSEFNVDLMGGENAFIVLRKDDKGNSQVESIYLWQDAKLSLIWKFQP
jgi:4-amino-4-deoxy-L-arabinose transferase-like glycosyltransferase